jgi:nucleoside-diphosphate-sugar epimerase
MEQPAVLVTGANGMVGRALCSALRARGSRVRTALRQAQQFSPNSALADSVIIGEIGPETDWRAALQGVECVVHLAARVHVMRESAADPLAEYRRVNTSGTERLARMAADAGVKRLVFVSTIKVNGEKSLPAPLSQGGSRPFSEADSPNPQDAYGISKWEAEQALARVASETGLEIVILRPPLVYGPGVKGNFLRLLNAVYRRVPLPLGSVKNRRSLIYLGNLVDAIALCVSHPRAAGQTFLVSDGKDLSTSELVRRLADALGRPAHLLSVPPALLKLAGSVTGKSDAVARLTESLRVDSSKIRAELNWSPPHSMEEGLRETAAWFRATVR